MKPHTKLHIPIVSTTLAVVLFGSTLITTFSTPAAAAPTDQLKLKVGEQRKVLVSVEPIMVRILQIGSDGWILVSIDPGVPGFRQGDNYWINTNQIWMISTPFEPSPPKSK